MSCMHLCHLNLFNIFPLHQDHSKLLSLACHVRSSVTSLCLALPLTHCSPATLALDVPHTCETSFQLKTFHYFLFPNDSAYRHRADSQCLSDPIEVSPLREGLPGCYLEKGLPTLHDIPLFYLYQRTFSDNEKPQFSVSFTQLDYEFYEIRSLVFLVHHCISIVQTTGIPQVLNRRF